MNTQTFKKRIAFAYKKDGELMQRFFEPIDYLESLSKGKHVHPYSWTSAKRHWNVRGSASMETTKELCKKLGLKLKKGNDAPRGGVEGDFFYLEKNDIRKLADVKFSSLK